MRMVQGRILLAKDDKEIIDAGKLQLKRGIETECCG